MIEQLKIEINKKKISKQFVHKYLDKLESQVDPEKCIEAENQQLRVFKFESVERLPILITMRDDVAHISYGHSDWPFFSFDETWNDYGAMLLCELQPVYESMNIGDDKVFTLRPNLSQIFAASLFEAEGTYERINENSMPAVHKPPSKERLIELMETEIDYKNHWTVQKYIDVINEWKDILHRYPNLNRCTHFSLPDLQGPFNLYFLLRGSNAYTDFYDDPGFTHRVMSKLTEMLSNLSLYLASFLGQSKIAYYWNYAYPGLLRNVDDNAILISRQQYREFVHPYNIKLYEKCCGGIHHFCGNGEHIIDDILSIPGLYGINFGNPEMNDLEKTYLKALSQKVVLLWDREIPPNLFNLMNKGLIMRIIVPTLAEGRKKLSEYADVK